MVKEELIARSPVRAFMRAIDGGLRPGEIGVIASPSGLGKTSVLVQIALDKLLQGQKVIHVSFTQQADYVLAWYDDIFDELTQTEALENKRDVRDEIIKNRVLMQFNQESVTQDQVLRSLKALICEGGFKAEALIVDGYAFSPASGERLEKVRAFAKEAGLVVWYSCNVKGDAPYNAEGVPLVMEAYAGLAAALVVLDPQDDCIALRLLKNRAVYHPACPPLRLDPGTLLLLE
ncbi:MAG: hypothetical protein LBR16_07425 [Treponema sp.]|jgi:hypothetical protein|nr:hypothetical protein [Treponema sp.]